MKEGIALSTKKVTRNHTSHVKMKLAVAQATHTSRNIICILHLSITDTDTNPAVFSHNTMVRSKISVQTWHVFRGTQLLTLDSLLHQYADVAHLLGIQNPDGPAGHNRAEERPFHPGHAQECRPVSPLIRLFRTVSTGVRSANPHGAR